MLQHTMIFTISFDNNPLPLHMVHLRSMAFCFWFGIWEVLEQTKRENKFFTEYSVVFFTAGGQGFFNWTVAI